MNRKYPTAQEFEDELRKQPVGYLDNGTVRHPVNYSSLIRECERLYAALREMKTSIQQWKVSLLSPTPEDPFRRIDCKIVDVGYADKAIVVEAETSVDDED